MFNNFNYMILGFLGLIYITCMVLLIVDDRKKKNKNNNLEDEIVVLKEELTEEKQKNKENEFGVRMPLVLMSMSEIFTFLDSSIDFEVNKIIENDFKLKNINYIDEDRAKDIADVVINNTLGIMSQNMIDNIKLYYTDEGMFNYIFYKILPVISKSIQYYNLPK